MTKILSQIAQHESLFRAVYLIPFNIFFQIFRIVEVFFRFFIFFHFNHLLVFYLTFMPLNCASKLFSCLFVLIVNSLICFKNKSSTNSLLSSILCHLLFFIKRAAAGSLTQKGFILFQDLNPDFLANRKVSSTRIARSSYCGINFIY